MSSKSKLAIMVLSAVALVATTACSETLDTDRLEEELQAQIAARIGEEPAAVEVSCPDSVELSEGETFECEATIEGSGETVLVTQDDDEGSVTWELVGAGDPDAADPEAPDSPEDPDSLEGLEGLEGLEDLDDSPAEQDAESEEGAP